MASSTVQLRQHLFNCDDTGTLVLGEHLTGKTSLSFGLCHEVARDLGESSVFVCRPQSFRDEFPLPVNVQSQARVVGSENGAPVSRDALFAPSALKRIGLLHPESPSHLLEQLMELTFSSPSPRLLVLDGLSCLLDPAGSRSLSDPVLLRQAARVLGHLFDLAHHLRSRCSTAAPPASTTGNLPRVVVTEGRLREGADRAYWALLRRFCGRVLLLRRPPRDLPPPSSPSSASQSPVRIYVSPACEVSSSESGAAGGGGQQGGGVTEWGLALAQLGSAGLLRTGGEEKDRSLLVLLMDR